MHGDNLSIEELDAFVHAEYARLDHAVVFGDREQPWGQDVGICVHKRRVAAQGIPVSKGALMRTETCS